MLTLEECDYFYEYCLCVSLNNGIIIIEHEEIKYPLLFIEEEED